MRPQKTSQIHFTFPLGIGEKQMNTEMSSLVTTLISFACLLKYNLSVHIMVLFK